jgi:hypothetical protein
MCFQWLVVRLDAVDEDELRKLVFDAGASDEGPHRLTIRRSDGVQHGRAHLHDRCYLRPRRRSVQPEHRVQILNAEAGPDDRDRALRAHAR